MASGGYGKRLERAILLYGLRHGGRVSLAEFGRVLAAAEGRADPFGASTLSNWISERNEPRLATFEALARLVGGEPSWYAFGSGRGPSDAEHDAPAPPVAVAVPEPEVRLVQAPVPVPLTPEQMADPRDAERERQEREQRARKRPRMGGVKRRPRD